MLLKICYCWHLVALWVHTLFLSTDQTDLQREWLKMMGPISTQGREVQLMMWNKLNKWINYGGTEGKFVEQSNQFWHKIDWIMMFKD